MSAVEVHTLGWSVERPAIFDGDEKIWCGLRAGEDFEYDLEVRVRTYAGAPARTPRGEYAPIDPPEPPECEIERVTFAGTSVDFPWPLSAAEEEAIVVHAAEMWL